MRARTARRSACSKTGDAVIVLERRGDWTRIEVGETAGWIPGFVSRCFAAAAPSTSRCSKRRSPSFRRNSTPRSARRAADKERLEQLAVTDAERETAMRRMSEENRDLRAGERWPYLVTGAGILGIGLAVGLLLRGGTRRSSSRIRF